ncbi:MAG: hypothetical protein R3252_02120 [Robiginitalea sp.]|nr:hypothetical protein [Robiginitalea sp.]
MKYPLSHFRAMPMILLFSLTTNAGAQENQLPYREIPDPPEAYSAGGVISRLIDGLGFRFFWATEGLREEDLAFRPGEEARSTGETVDHIYGLSRVVLNTALKKPNTSQTPVPMTFDEKRAEVLHMLKQASDIFRQAEDLSQYSVVFVRDGNRDEFPFWNQINGPISDALWHCGQIVSHRRSSGNPFNSRVSVFTGKVRQ